MVEDEPRVVQACTIFALYLIGISVAMFSVLIFALFVDINLSIFVVIFVLTFVFFCFQIAHNSFFLV